MVYSIRSDIPPHYDLCENDETASILQNISLLISTRKGTVPMYRDFGIEMDFLDMPEIIAETVAAQDIISAVEEFEPRAKVQTVKAVHSEEGKLILILEVEI